MPVYIGAVKIPKYTDCGVARIACPVKNSAEVLIVWAAVHHSKRNLWAPSQLNCAPYLFTEQEFLRKATKFARVDVTTYIEKHPSVISSDSVLAVHGVPWKR